LIALNQSTLLLTKIAVNTWYVNIIPKLFLSPDAGGQYSATLSLLNASFISTNALVSPQLSGDGGGVATLRALFGGGVNNRWESTVRLRLAAGLTPSNAQDLTPKSYVDAIPNPTLNVLPKKGASGFVDSIISNNGTNLIIGNPLEGNFLFNSGDASFRYDNSTRLQLTQNHLSFGAGYGASGNGGFRLGDGNSFSYITASGTDLLLQAIQGRVGIRTTTPTEALDVEGSIKLSNLLKLGQFTTATEPAYVKGASFFNTTLNKMRIGGATAYETVTSS
jgi:hypothetical protein